jgi:hypothetical protein
MNKVFQARRDREGDREVGGPASCSAALELVFALMNVNAHEWWRCILVSRDSCKCAETFTQECWDYNCSRKFYKPSPFLYRYGEASMAWNGIQTSLWPLSPARSLDAGRMVTPLAPLVREHFLRICCHVLVDLKRRSVRLLCALHSFCHVAIGWFFLHLQTRIARQAAFCDFKLDNGKQPEQTAVREGCTDDIVSSFLSIVFRFISG